jgi:hypothetical protein
MNLRELEKWMESECFNTNTFTTGIKPAPFEGFGLERREDGSFIWYFTERGRIDVIRVFSDETEACLFALEEMKNSKTAKTHLVGFFEREELQKALRREVAERGIEFLADKIPFEKDSDRYRVFVFGCDHREVKDLAEKYKQLESRARWQKK